MIKNDETLLQHYTCEGTEGVIQSITSKQVYKITK